jgi:hypothetical protein
MFQRLLSERRICIPWFTATFAVVFAGINIWLLDLRSSPALLSIALVSLGGGWLCAIYMWHLNDAAAHAWEPWVTPKQDKEKSRDSSS